MIEHLVDASIGKAGKLDFGNGNEALGCKPDRQAGDGRFSQRRVNDPFCAELLKKPVGGAKDATIDPDIFAKHDHAGIVGHRPFQGQADGVHKTDLRHGQASVRTSRCSARSAGRRA